MKAGRWMKLLIMQKFPVIILLSDKMKQKLKYETNSWKVG